MCGNKTFDINHVARGQKNCHDKFCMQFVAKVPVFVTTGRLKLYKLNSVQYM